MNKLNKYISQQFYKLFLRIFKSKKNKNNIDLKTCKDILVIQFGDLQEALSITPLLKVLNENVNCKITILGTENNSFVFSNNPHIHNFVKFQGGFALIKQVVSELNIHNYNAIINTHEELNSTASYFVGLIRSQNKVGFNNLDEKILTHRISKLNVSKNHKIDRILCLLKAFDLDLDKSDLNYIISPSSKSISIIEDYFVKHDLSFKLTVLLNISNKNEYGFWGIVNYQKLIKYINNYDVNIIVSASIEDIEVAEAIANNNHLIYYNDDLDVFSELINKVNFVISPDSFIIQLASAFKVPAFCLFTQKELPEMMNVPYNSDFDFALTEKPKLETLSLGNVLNSFVPYLEYIYEKNTENKK